MSNLKKDLLSIVDIILDESYYGCEENDLRCGRINELACEAKKLILKIEDD